ncbi:DUF2523 domain-containing protein [Xanthomonas translucens pv. translucens]|uniref:DUF2523 family protein n=1 Tax=Xanthomonas campestris pv. translucens TaxID=343 RepID=UPI0009BCEE03|nr:DUF2523 family protein [Xanthomonas translucens]MCS3360676.1 DUF2523 domain-containing protein [Xanthomonas translucens pv. translucens]MCS3373292.1 DUF2523 domain-containing protein [Xanthomonas translucens pv. translucens]MCT8290253.1 DUF2523 domain-containing protein [Xanthomonas translucens pv. translucens]MCT8293935.1 DUF2523 domain-containing protein [Xanthomonas translucens pv. translucens]MCT8312351.1 DUF2523 domain-containing protein [Xanthomonas translucens pv. translucens]
MFDWAKNFADNFFANATDAIHKLIKLKAAIWLGRLLSAVGLGFAAQKFIYNPIIDYAQNAWSAVPVGIANWVHAFGIDAGISIILSAYGIRGAERIFIQRRNQAS